MLHVSVIKRIRQNPIKGSMRQRRSAVRAEAQASGFVRKVEYGVVARSVKLEDPLDDRAIDRIDYLFPQLMIPKITKGGTAGPFSSAKSLPISASDIFSKIIDVILGLAECDREYELSLGRAVEPKGREFEVLQDIHVQKMDQPAPVHGVPGQAVRVPGQNSFGLSLFESGKHFIKNGPSG